VSDRPQIVNLREFDFILACSSLKWCLANEIIWSGATLCGSSYCNKVTIWCSWKYNQILLHERL